MEKNYDMKNNKLITFDDFEGDTLCVINIFDVMHSGNTNDCDESLETNTDNDSK